MPPKTPLKEKPPLCHRGPKQADAKPEIPEGIKPEGIPERPSSIQEPESYGIHRFSTATRLVITFLLVACVSVLFFALTQMSWAFAQSIVLGPSVYLGLVITVLLAVALATAVGLYAARGITRPLDRMTKTAQEIKAENYTARTGLSGYDEIGRLGRVLDEMAGTIQRNTEYERQITADVAHELRTPLMAIRANLEAMIDGVLPTDNEQLDALNSEILRLGRLIEGQLQLSRLEARKVAFQPHRLDLGELSARLAGGYRQLAEDQGLTLRISTQSDVMVYADADLIRQIMANLIANAIRYTPASGTVSIQVQRNGTTALLTVQDTGIGIKPQDQQSIFNKFWRADDSRGHGGLGIGLAVVRAIVNMHGGSIEVRSQPGRGASFTVSLPLSRP
ncbi:MAG: HAMP domain-containing histidine kinase [Coriobacteriales bacterium]|jgi:signal transduction histidine kinase|nr:HAMP domain-containing histidine kinase [Coriobacteriales bacterium]